MSLRPVPGHANPTDQRGRQRVLERAYPLAKQLAEILEIETVEPMATAAKRLRQAIGVALGQIGVGAEEGIRKSRKDDVVVDGPPCQPHAVSRRSADVSS